MELLGQSESMNRMRSRVKIWAPKDSPVLVVGETGTGKELIARALHSESNRTDAPFLTVNCSDFAGDNALIQSELFGHKKGAFTGASQSRKGVFEEAGTGTVFLDEIGNLPRPIQGKLLRVLDQRVVRPVGSNKEIPISCRIIAASNKKKGDSYGLNPDLFFRFQPILETTPLRENKEELVLFFLKFMKEFWEDPSEEPYLGFAAVHQLLHYDWPGNVRELRNRVYQYATEMKYAIDFQEEIAATDLWFTGPRYLVDFFDGPPWNQAGLEYSSAVWVNFGHFSGTELKDFHRKIVRVRSEKRGDGFRSLSLQLLLNKAKEAEAVLKEMSVSSDESTRRLAERIIDQELRRKSALAKEAAENERHASIAGAIRNLTNTASKLSHSFYKTPHPNQPMSRPPEFSVDLAQPLGEVLRKYCKAVLEANGNNKSKTSTILKIGRARLNNWLKEEDKASADGEISSQLEGGSR